MILLTVAVGKLAYVINACSFHHKMDCSQGRSMNLLSVQKLIKLKYRHQNLQKAEIGGKCLCGRNGLDVMHLGRCPLLVKQNSELHAIIADTS